MLKLTEACRAALRSFFHTHRAGRRARTGASKATRSFLFMILAATVTAQFWTAPPASAQPRQIFNTFDLTASANYVLVGYSATLTATYSLDVGPTPYYIEIFDQTTGLLVPSACGYGTVCAVSVQIIQSCHTVLHTFIAYLAEYGTMDPPPGIVATSNPWTVQFTGPPC